MNKFTYRLRISYHGGIARHKSSPEPLSSKICMTPNKIEEDTVNNKAILGAPRIANVIAETDSDYKKKEGCSAPGIGAPINAKGLY